MIDSDTMRGLYKAEMAVTPFGAGGQFTHAVLIVADDFEQARMAAEPTVGHYSFELISLARIGKVSVTERQGKSA